MKLSQSNNKYQNYNSGRMSYIKWATTINRHNNTQVEFIKNTYLILVFEIDKHSKSIRINFVQKGNKKYVKVNKI